MSQNPTSLEQRFAEILERNRRRIGAIARNYGRGQSDDLLQEILLQIWRSLPKFRDESRIDTWCYRIALNTAMTWTRSADRRKNVSTNTSDPVHIPGIVDGHHPLELLQRFLDTLSDTDRAIVMMYLDDLSSAQMSEVLGLTEGAIRVRIHRIKQRLSEWEAIEP